MKYILLIIGLVFVIIFIKQTTSNLQRDIDKNNTHQQQRSTRVFATSKSSKSHRVMLGNISVGFAFPKSTPAELKEVILQDVRNILGNLAHLEIISDENPTSLILDGMEIMPTHMLYWKSGHEVTFPENYPFSSLLKTGDDFELIVPDEAIDRYETSRKLLKKYNVSLSELSELFQKLNTKSAQWNPDEIFLFDKFYGSSLESVAQDMPKFLRDSHFSQPSVLEYTEAIVAGHLLVPSILETRSGTSDRTNAIFGLIFHQNRWKLFFYQRD